MLVSLIVCLCIVAAVWLVALTAGEAGTQEEAEAYYFVPTDEAEEALQPPMMFPIEDEDAVVLQPYEGPGVPEAQLL